jgi:HEAT repeat protein
MAAQTNVRCVSQRHRIRHDVDGPHRDLMGVYPFLVACLLGVVVMIGCSGAPVEVDKPVPELIADLGSFRPQTRYNAAYTLNQMKPPPQACVGTLVAAIKREDYENIRAMMLWVLVKAAPATPEILPATLELLETGQEVEALFAAVGILGALGAPASSRSVPALIAAFDDSRCGQKAPYALGRIGPSARAASSALARALDPNDHSRPWLLRSSIADALVAIDAPAEIAVPALQKVIDQGNMNALDAERCAAALGHFGAAATPAVPVLIRLLETSERNRIYVRANSADSLGQIGPPAAAAVPSLIRGLKDEAEAVRYAAAKALGGIGPAARAAVPDLIAALDHPDALFAVYAARSLGAIATNEPEIIDALSRVRKPPMVLDVAQQMLAQINERNRKASTHQ